MGRYLLSTDGKTEAQEMTFTLAQWGKHMAPRGITVLSKPCCLGVVGYNSPPKWGVVTGWFRYATDPKAGVWASFWIGAEGCSWVSDHLGWGVKDSRWWEPHHPLVCYQLQKLVFFSHASNELLSLGHFRAWLPLGFMQSLLSLSLSLREQSLQGTRP